MRKILLTSTLIFLTTLGCQKQENSPLKLLDQTKSDGHEQGNGSDNTPWEFGTAWVLGENTELVYCYERSKDFGVNDGVITKTLKNTFEQWHQYILDKNVNIDLAENFISRMKLKYPDADQEILDKSKLYYLPVKSRLLAKCDGSENIKFYFGSEDELIHNLKKKYFNPTAFAYRTSYNSKTGQGKGVIWLAKQGGLGEHKFNYPDWSLPTRLHGVLLHEIGHVYGVGHIENTIMQEDMWGLLIGPGSTTEDQNTIQYKNSHIDHQRELYVTSIDKNHQMYIGTMAFRQTGSPELIQAEIAENFEFIMGHKPNGEVTAQFQNQNIIIFDSVSTRTFSLKVDTSLVTSTLQSIFRGMRNWDNPISGNGIVGSGQALGHTSRNLVGEIETSSGQIVSILIEQNYWQPMRISYIKNGKPQALMIMKYLF